SEFVTHSGGDFIPQPVLGGGMVRIASHKLDRLIAGSDDLLTTRLFITHRMRDLEDMMSSFSLWRWNQTQIEGDLHHIREFTSGIQKSALPAEVLPPLERIVDFLAFDREFVSRLQHDLALHIRATEVDRSALESSTNEISDLIHDAVLVPVAGLLSSFSKFVREYSRSVGKSVDFQIVGKDIEMDRRILEAIKSPLMHLIHNAIDHGIEYSDIREKQGKSARGMLQIRVTTHSGSKVTIDVIDDGAGIDRSLIKQAAVEKGVISSRQEANITDEEAIWLIFRSGLSTKSEVTDLSGRGLGLAIVDDSVTRLGGELMVSSEPLKGTTISIILPVRLATLRGVVVRSGSQTYVFPIQQIGKVIRADPDSFFYQGNRMVVRIEGEIIRVIKLTEALGVPDISYQVDGLVPIPLVTLEYAGRQIACVVDEVIRVQEIVVRPLGSLLRRIKRITGAVILGDGAVAMVLDPLEIIQEAFSTGHHFIPDPPLKRSVKKILVVDDSATSRALLRRILEVAGYQVHTAYDGIDAFGKLKNFDFNLVVSDVDMPRMSGYTLTEKIRADDRFRHIPVFLVTSLHSTQDQDYGKAVGANAYIVKSRFEKNTFLTIIKELLYNQ
ncbi:MAG: response regulator, partial [Methanobacteriota archaeon]